MSYTYELRIILRLYLQSVYKTMLKLKGFSIQVSVTIIFSSHIISKCN